jgi:hypothetical protein
MRPPLGPPTHIPIRASRRGERDRMPAKYYSSVMLRYAHQYPENLRAGVRSWIGSDRSEHVGFLTPENRYGTKTAVSGGAAIT